MQVTFAKQKAYPNGDFTLILKNGTVCTDTIKAQQKRQTTIFWNKAKRLRERKELLSQFNDLNGLITDGQTERKKRIIECKLNQVNPDNIRRSVGRARQELEDICKCNDFQYFVTLTFDQDKIDRLNDTETRKAFSRWADYARRKFPYMYYVGAPEYHKKGGLHFHLLIGGIAFEDLKPVLWKKQTKGKHKGQDIYNITAWQHGYSTMTVINEQTATKHYICKYISKQNADERFFNKKRYYASRNTARPTVIKDTILQSQCNMWDIDLCRFNVSYFDFKKQYGIFTARTAHSKNISRGDIGVTIRKRQLYNFLFAFEVVKFYT